MNQKLRKKQLKSSKDFNATQLYYEKQDTKQNKIEQGNKIQSQPNLQDEHINDNNLKNQTKEQKANLLPERLINIVNQQMKKLSFQNFSQINQKAIQIVEKNLEVAPPEMNLNQIVFNNSQEIFYQYANYQQTINQQLAESIKGIQYKQYQFKQLNNTSIKNEPLFQEKIKKIEIFLEKIN